MYHVKCLEFTLGFFNRVSLKKATHIIPNDRCIVLIKIPFLEGVHIYYKNIASIDIHLSDFF